MRGFEAGCSETHSGCAQPRRAPGPAALSRAIPQSCSCSSFSSSCSTAIAIHQGMPDGVAVKLLPPAAMLQLQPAAGLQLQPHQLSLHSMVDGDGEELTGADPIL